MASSASAKFAASNGEFSGKGGDTCILCHARAAATQQAVVSLEGLPSRWISDHTYSLTIRVEGGPPPMPSPRPQGGFELASSGGTFAPGPGMETFLRFPQPNVITYTPEGTRMRTWQVDWTAPTLEANPAPVTFWVATVAANGNHFTSGDQGATGDAVATTSITVRAADETLEKWRAMALLPPIIDETRADETGGWLVKGSHTDANATHLGYRVDGGTWKTVLTAPTWTLITSHDPETLELRSEGMGRVSPSARKGPVEEASLPHLAAVIVLGVVAVVRYVRRDEVKN